MLFETAQDVWRGGWSNWVVISILTSVLAIFGLVLQITFSLNVVTEKLSDQLEFSVYLSDDVELKNFALKLSKLEHIKRVEVIEKNVAWNEFRKNFIIADIFENPLPNTIHIRVFKQENLKPIIEMVKEMPGVIDINYAPGVLNFINKLKMFLQILGGTLTVLLAFATIVITGNTIQLVIHLRQKEIEILRLMGVEDWYIRGPLILQGIFYAIIAATVAIVPLYALQSFIWEVAQTSIGGVLPTGLPRLTGNIFYIYYLLLLVGVFVAGTGCLLSTRKYLKV